MGQKNLLFLVSEIWLNFQINNFNNWMVSAPKTQVRHCALHEVYLMAFWKLHNFLKAMFTILTISFSSHTSTFRIMPIWPLSWHIQRRNHSIAVTWKQERLLPVKWDLPTDRAEFQKHCPCQISSGLLQKMQKIRWSHINYHIYSLTSSKCKT